MQSAFGANAEWVALLLKPLHDGVEIPSIDKLPIEFQRSQKQGFHGRQLAVQKWLRGAQSDEQI